MDGVGNTDIWAGFQGAGKAAPGYFRIVGNRKLRTADSIGTKSPSRSMTTESKVLGRKVGCTDTVSDDLARQRQRSETGCRLNRAEAALKVRGFFICVSYSVANFGEGKMRP